jgi:hypothetical protein
MAMAAHWQAILLATATIIHVICFAVFAAEPNFVAEQSAVAVNGTTSNPGLKIRLSQPGLNYAANVAVEILVAGIWKFHIPDQHPPVHHADFDVTNMKVSSLCNTLP